MACSQESQMHWNSTVTESLKYLGRAMVFHRGGFGRSFMSTPVAPGWFDNDRFRALSQSNGLPAESIFGMAEDDDGYWWIAIDVGVLRVSAGAERQLNGVT
jgi:hypothetical protein